MSSTSPIESPLKLFHGGVTRNFAMWTMVICALLLSFFAASVAWPLGPKHVNEGTLTTLRFSIALLAVAQVFALIAMIAFLRDILLTLRRLDVR